MTCCLSKSLNAKIAISAPSDVVDAVGGVTQQWSVMAQPWAKVEHIEPRGEAIGLESFSAEQQFAEATTKFTIRHSATNDAINATYRVTWDGEEYDILGSFNSPAVRPREIHIYGKTRTD